MQKRIRLILVLLILVLFGGFFVNEALAEAHDAPPVGSSVCVDGPFWAVTNGTATTENTGGVKVHVGISSTSGEVTQDKTEVVGDGKVITFNIGAIPLTVKSITVTATTTWGKDGKDIHTVTISQPAAGCIPPKPDDLVVTTYTDWVLPDFSCPDHSTGTETRTKTVTTTTYIYDEGTNTWIKGSPTAVTTVESKIVQWYVNGVRVICAETNPPPTITFHPTPSESSTSSDTPPASPSPSKTVKSSSPAATTSSSRAAITAIPLASTSTDITIVPVADVTPVQHLANTGSKTENMLLVVAIFFVSGLICLAIAFYPRSGKYTR